MTAHQVLIVAALGGILGIAGLALFVATVVGVFAGTRHLVERAGACRDRRRIRREDLNTCRAIHALGTTTEPKDPA